MFVYFQKKIIIKTVLIIIISIIFSVSLINFSFSDEIKNLTDLKKLGKNLKNKIEKKESSDTKSQNCNLDKNLIYYKNVDEYYVKVGPEAFSSNGNELFSSFSFLAKNNNKNYIVEYVFNPNGNLTATRLDTCEPKKYKWVYKSKTYGPKPYYKDAFKIYLGDEKNKDLEMSFYLYGADNYKHKIIYYRRGQIANCYNEMNPQCNKKIAEQNIIGFRDLKNNLTYEKLRDDYINKIKKIRKEQEEKKKAELLKKQQEEQKRKEDEERRRKEEEERKRKVQEAREKEYKAKQEFDSSPAGQLQNSYLDYLVIKNLYEAREGYAVVYVNSQQMKAAKKKIKEIEKKIKELGNINTDKIWNNATNIYKKKYDWSISMAKSSGVYTNQYSGIAKLSLISLENIYKEVVGSSIEKDF
tara:strand:+ start:206 stop:1441 length:1236 start_codon:yes stop_codon:yes gene_type:complete